MKQKTNLFFIGDWQVSPASNSLSCGDTIRQLEPKAMDVLLLLCQHPGEVHSTDNIVSQCWGNGEIGDNPVHKAINQLRKAFDDKPGSPKYIETIRKRGYRIVAPLDFPLNDELNAAHSTWQGESPFPGLSAFSPRDAGVFFGRSEQIATLLGRISTQVSYGRAFCLILGPSGSGKSSLVNAGLLPKLLHHNGYDGIGVVSYSQLDFADVSQHRLLVDLAAAMLDWDIGGQPVFDGMSADTLARQLQQDCHGLIQQCQLSLSKTTNTFSKPHFFLFIDRLEVLLSSPLFSEEECSHFLRLIDTLATSGCILVFSACRNDFYPLVVSHPSLMAGKAKGAHFDLMPPQHSELMQMIRLPAVAAGLSWSKDRHNARPLDEVLCAEAASNPDSLPMLQYTLQELYLQRSDSGLLQFSVYKDLGGIEGAIGKKAEEIFLQLPEQQQSQLAYVLSQLVTLSPDGETVTSRTARWSQLSNPDQADFVQALVDNRLLVSHLQHDEACFSLAHEALLRRWQRASKWIAEHQDSLISKSRLHQLSQQWLSEGKSKAYLLAQGKPLQDALSLYNNAVFALDDDENALLKASLKRLSIKRWVRRGVFSLLCLLTFTAVLMSVKSQQAESLAQHKRLEAESLLGFMVGEFADKLRSVKRMDLLDGISNKALEYFSQQDMQQTEHSLFSLTDAKLNFKARFQHAQTLGAMGEVAYSRGKNDEAQQAFSSAKVLLDNLYTQQPDNLELLKTLGANTFWLGQLAMDNAQFTQAKAYFAPYLAYSQAMLKLAPDNQDVQWELSYAYLAVGSVNTKLQISHAAKAAFKTALAIQSELVKKLPKDDISHSDIADTLEWLAETEEQLGHLPQAVQTRLQAQTILLDLLTTHSNNGDILETLAYSYFNNANIKYYLGDYVGANQAILTAITYFNTLLSQDPANQLWQLQLIAAQAFRGYLTNISNSEVLGPLPDIEDFKKILNRAETYPSILVIFIKNYQINGHWDIAEDAIKLAKAKLEELVEKQPNNSKFLFSLSNIYLTAAKQTQNSQLNNNHAKLSVCQQVIALLHPKLTVNSGFELLLPYVQAYDCLGNSSEVQNFVDRLERMQINNYHF